MKNTRIYLVAVLLSTFVGLFSLNLSAQDVDISGVWKGSISVPGVELEIVLDFEKDGAEWKGNIDIPLQKVTDMTVSDIAVDGPSVKWKMPDAPGGANFDGKVTEDGEEMKGDFKQAGKVFPLLVRRESAAEKEAEQKRIAASLAKFRLLADSLIVKRHVPGIGVAIVYKGEVVLSEGFGYRDFEKKVKADENTNFAIGSSSKAFTSMSLGILVDEGKLEWDEPVRTYLPDFKMQDRFATEQMTTLDLLTHRSGLPRHDFAWYGTPFTREELYQRLQYFEPNKPFRANWQYQNLMYMTAGYLAGKINGTTWEELVQERIFKPLEMNRSNFDIEGLKSDPNTALGYAWDKEKESMLKLDYRNLSAIGPAGSINSNPVDMANWLRLHLGNGKFKGEKIVSGISLHEMHRPQMVVGRGGNDFVSPVMYGLGWMTYEYKGHTVVEHGGNIDGFSAEVWVMPDDELGLVILSNANTTAIPTLLCRYATDLFLDLEETDWDERAFGKDAKEDADPTKEKDSKQDKAKPVKGTKPSHALVDYAAEFEHKGYGIVKVVLADKQLRMQYNGFDLPMDHWHYDVFSAKEEILGMDFKLTFHSSEAGEIHKLTIPIEQFAADIEFLRLPPQRLSDPEVLGRMSGTFMMEEQAIQFVVMGKDKLVMVAGGQGKYNLIPWRNTEFKAEGLNGYSVEFVEGKDGKFDQVILHQPNGNFTATREKEE